MLITNGRRPRATLAVRAFLAHADLVPRTGPVPEGVASPASKAALLAALRAETRAVVLLARAIPATRLDFRPAPGQRSTLELLRYLTLCAIAPATHAMTGRWDHAKALEAQAARLRFADIPAALDAQFAALERLLAPVSEAEFATRQAKAPWGARCALREALGNGALKFLACYREELALHARAAGASAR